MWLRGPLRADQVDLSERLERDDASTTADKNNVGESNGSVTLRNRLSARAVTVARFEQLVRHRLQPGDIDAINSLSGRGSARWSSPTLRRAPTWDRRAPTARPRAPSQYVKSPTRGFNSVKKMTDATAIEVATVDE